MKTNTVFLLLGVVLCLALVSQANQVTVPCKQPNAIHKTCGTACPITCANMNHPPPACTFQCVEGCFCKDGYYANSVRRCVRKSEAEFRILKPLKKHVQHYTVWLVRISGFGELKKQQKFVVIFVNFVDMSKHEKAFMKDFPPGNFSLTRPITTDLELETECRSKIGKMKTNTVFLLLGVVLCLALVGQAKEVTVPCNQPNAIYKPCGTACPITCANIHDPPETCTSQCVAGCFCKDGYYANSVRRCVRKSECS
ncbi:von Willebrand factor-like [Pelobates fuscus]|uniref:von Willebrand factor-like n=1 Tax=Pelobates fuscus TaxID=191477 RepID=UPI002FE4AE7B